jgi:Asp-tRNA(Asn)/Glu-tRNA(Gln) amidotransferase A subunit family amidase
MQKMDALFSRVDVLLAPAATGSMTVIGNMTGHPCLTTRAGFTDMRTREMPAFLNAEIEELEGPTYTVPHAITIVAPLFDEAAALTVGQAMEASSDVEGQRPNLA